MPDDKQSRRPKTARKRSEYAVQAVSNAIRVLETLGSSDHEQSLPELCEKVGLTKHNAAKLFATLEEFGYMELNPYTNNYRLGVKTFQISQTYINRLNLLDVALPIQRKLAADTGESVYVSVLRRENVVYLGVVETTHPVRVLPRIGNVGPAYATATGKVQLAFLSEREIEQMYISPFIKHTPNTVANLNELLGQLPVIREKGFAVDNEEYEVGVRCVAAPIKNFMGVVIGALSISAPTERMGDANVKELLPKLSQSASKLSTKFGYI